MNRAILTAFIVKLAIAFYDTKSHWQTVHVAYFFVIPSGAGAVFEAMRMHVCAPP